MDDLDDDRVEVRYRVYLQAQLDGIDLTVNNISDCGLQFSCPEFLLDKIKDSLDQSQFDLDISLPSIETPCRAKSKLIYSSSVGEEQLIGVQFDNLENEHKHSLHQYLQDLADKNAPVVNM